jgi:exosortase B
VSSVLPAFGPRTNAGATDAAWLVAIVGFAAMYLPVYWAAGNTIWQTDDNAHGALILAVMVWLFWSLRHQIETAALEPVPIWGAVLFGFGTLVYFVGRAADVLMLAIASQPFIVAGILLLLRGGSALRLAWFPIIYFVFMIPLPGTLVDGITGPLKQWISVIVVELLYRVGYPISRNGVILEIGQYQMLVADACSGLHSMYSLSALGTLFMYITRRKGLAHNAIMLASILPIAFVANIVRVAVLVLITYHFGDEAGQGFLHGAAGMVLMLVALASLFALDRLLVRVLGGDTRNASHGARAAAEEPG